MAKDSWEQKGKTGSLQSECGFEIRKPTRCYSLQHFVPRSAGDELMESLNRRMILACVRVSS
jgi:hypothetical protein